MPKFVLDPAHPPGLTDTQLRRLTAMTDADITRSADADPDSPLLDGDPVYLVLQLRRRLGLSQVAFAARFGVPVGTLRDWEQGRTRPDGAAVAYIRVMAAMPEQVAGVLAAA